jgi:acyl-CoA synthetase (AMP-forming)/AMP-acid ligase II
VHGEERGRSSASPQRRRPAFFCGFTWRGSADSRSLTARAILVYAREKLAPFQRIRRIEFMELPKTISGKIRRVELREREAGIAIGTIVALEWRDDEFPGLRG